MRSKTWIGVALAGVAGMSGVAMGTPLTATDGVNIGVDTYLYPYTPFSGSPAQSIDFVTYSGALNFWGLRTETAPFANDGGLMLTSGKVRVSLQDNVTQDGAFEVWRGSDSYIETTGFPLFKVNSVDNTAAFKGVDVAVTKKGTTGGNLSVEGTLTVAGRPVVTSAGGSGLTLGTAVFTPGINSFSVANGKGTGTNSAAFGSSTASGSTSFAAGASATASGLSSVAIGTNASATVGSAIAIGSGAIAQASPSLALLAGVASGTNSVAVGGGQASGNSSTAVGYGVASGDRSIALGFSTMANTLTSVAVGCANAYTVAGPSGWIDTDPMFTVGNGRSDTDRSTGLEMLKNGQTTLRNRFWVPGSPTAPVTTVGANDGKALVVEGNTELKGKVIIAVPQGDISMGVYAP